MADSSSTNRKRRSVSPSQALGDFGESTPKRTRRSKAKAATTSTALAQSSHEVVDITPTVSAIQTSQQRLAGQKPAEPIDTTPLHPTDPYSASSPLPSIAEEDASTIVEQIDGQLRAARIAQKNAALGTEIEKIDTASAKQLQGRVRKAVELQKLNTESLKFGQEVENSNIEGERLSQRRQAVEGEQQLSVVLKETLDAEFNKAKARVKKIEADTASILQRIDSPAIDVPHLEI